MKGTSEYALSVAMDHHRSGRLAAAEAAYRNYLSHCPEDPQANYCLGNLLARRGCLDNAISHLEVAAQAGYANAGHDLAWCYERLGDAGKATQWLLDVIRQAPTHVKSLSRLGRLLCIQGHPRQGRTILLQALEQDADFAPAHLNLGLCHEQMDQWEAAEAAYRRSMTLAPQQPAAYVNLGNLLRQMGRLNEAEQYLRRAMDYDAPLTEALTNLALVEQERGHLQAALAHLDKAIAADPEAARAQWNRAVMLLQQGDLEAGWEAYEWGITAGVRRPRRLQGVPLWAGQPLAGRAVAVTAEQGLGDELMFASCLPDLVAQAKHCMVECDPRLVPLFQRSFPAARVIAHGGPPMTIPPAETQIPMGSLPGLYRRRDEAFPPHHGYLHADHNRLSSWRQRLAELGTGAKVGISWRGGSGPGERRKRTIPLGHWAKLFTVAEIHFVSLQYDGSADEFRHPDGRWPVTRWQDLDAFHDIDNLAALVAGLDLVITVDNTIAHLAGALGRPVWTLLPCAADWRWRRETTTSLWYPSMRLFRQPHDNGWPLVMDHVAQALACFNSSSRETIPADSPSRPAG